jgi:hypothetical protein
MEEKIEKVCEIIEEEIENALHSIEGKEEEYK